MRVSIYNFVDNHDVNRIYSLLTEKENLLNVYTMLFTMPGMPSIYYGSEWGIEGVKVKGADADVPLRPAIDIHAMEGINEDLITHIAALAREYRSNETLRKGGFENVEIKNQQLVYARYLDDDYTLVAFNLSNESWETKVTYRGDSHEISLGAHESALIH